MMCLTEESLFLVTNYNQSFLGRTHIKDALYYFTGQFCCMFKGDGPLAEYQVYRQWESFSVMWKSVRIGFVFS